MPDKLIDMMVAMREKEALAVAEEMLEGGRDPMEVVESCREAMNIVGKRFEEGTYFLPELILGGVILTQISDMAEYRMAQATTRETKRLGKVVIGTVKGDIHDIGKNIVAFMLDINGFEVLDLGVDVPPDKFVEAVREFEPQVVALSGFLTLVYDRMKTTVEAFEETNLRPKVKVMVGGGVINDRIREYVGADAFGQDAVAAVSLAKKFVEVNRHEKDC